MHNKLRSYFTKHKDRTTTTEITNIIYTILCRGCPQQYFGQEVENYTKPLSNK